MDGAGGSLEIFACISPSKGAPDIGSDAKADLGPRIEKPGVRLGAAKRGRNATPGKYSGAGSVALMLRITPFYARGQGYM